MGLFEQAKWETFWDEGWDVMLCPVTQTAAIPIDETGGIAGINSRTITVNGKDSPYFINFRWAGLIIIADLPVSERSLPY